MSLAIPVVIGLTAAGGMLAWGKVSALQDVADKLSYKISVKNLRMHTVTKLRFEIDVKLINPTREKFKISHPLIKIFGNGSELASSRMQKKIYELNGFSETTIKDIAFEVNLMSFVGDIKDVVSNIVSAFRKGGVAEAATIIANSQTELLKGKTVQIITEINNIPITIDESLGYSPGSAIERPVKDGSQFDSLFPYPKGKKKRIIRDGNVEQTVRAMIDVVNQDAHLIKEASKTLFQAETIKSTAKKIFDFVFKYLKYNLEDGEQLRNPLVTYDLGQRKAYDHFQKNGFWKREYSVDCDDISIFIASVLKNLNIPYKFRIASYKDYLGIDRGFSHVYVVIPGQTEIIIDPVYHRFNAEKSYSQKKDFKMNKELAGVDVYYLSGTNKLDGQILNAVKVLKPVIETDQDIYNYLLRSRKIIAANPQTKHKIPNAELLKMYDYALKYFWTGKRDQALEHLEKAETALISKGYIENEGLGGFFDKLKDTARNVLKRVSNKAKTGLVKNNYAHSAAAETVEKSGMLTVADDNGSQTGKKTLRTFVSKYRYPIAGATGVIAGGLSYMVYRKMQKKRNNGRK